MVGPDSPGAGVITTPGFCVAKGTAFPPTRAPLSSVVEQPGTARLATISDVNALLRPPGSSGVSWTQLSG